MSEISLPPPAAAPVGLAIVGAGSRGHAYARFAREHPERARVLAVAEPRAGWREPLAAEHGIPAGHVFASWEDLARRPRLADAVIIATQDRLHRAPAEAFAALGYDILLEKPMAPDEADCRAIAAAVERAGVLFAVCHVLLYTAYTRELKRLLDAGTIGEVASIQRLEPVGFWHQAHSFVRGNWRREDEGSFMLMAKACHDLDWLRHIVGAPCRRVSSFGGIRHFRPEGAPAGAGERCLDCAAEPACPYSAKRFYLDQLDRPGRAGWARIIAGEATPAAVRAALADGAYGRCVYRCDNDVVDHQVANFEFANGTTASFTMTAFTPFEDRKDRVFGTRGCIEGDGRVLRVFDFLSESTREIDTGAPAVPGGASGHGGGDFGVMDAFVRAVATRDAASILSGAAASLESHLMVFAAERARRNGTVESIDLTGAASGPRSPQA
jgi:predicted dehydrogenase